MSELSAHTLTRGDESFVHQHLVDVYLAQHVPAGARSTIGPAFALAGLYLAVERGFSGRQVQRLHVVMARRSRVWPVFTPPADLGGVTVADVLDSAPGPGLEPALMRWCSSVWSSWFQDHERVREMVDTFL